jgi:hypothetical protein
MTTAIDMENLDTFAELVKVAKEQGCYDLVSAAFKSGVKLGSDTEREAILDVVIGASKVLSLRANLLVVLEHICPLIRARRSK